MGKEIAWSWHISFLTGPKNFLFKKMQQIIQVTHQVMFIRIVTRSSFFFFLFIYIIIILKRISYFFSFFLSSFSFLSLKIMFETEESSVASSFGEDDMDLFLDRCSICFDAQLDMCLEFCRDQYCVECFQRYLCISLTKINKPIMLSTNTYKKKRYITEVVKSSWGLSVTPISCPVCNESIPKHEWSQYVPQHIVDTYDKFNKPYRSYIRTCPHCETDMIPCIHSSEKPSNYR